MGRIPDGSVVAIGGEVKFVGSVPPTPVVDGYQQGPAENIAEAERILASGCERLAGWLESEFLTLEDADDSTWGGLTRDWAAAGIKSYGVAWFNRAKRELVKRGVTARSKVASILVRKFARARVEKSSPSLVPLAKNQADLDFLPPHVQWVVRHPNLRMSLSTRNGCCAECRRPFADPVQRAVIDEYERENKAPNEAALTLYHRCLANEKLLDDLLKGTLKPQAPVGAEKPSGEPEERPAAEQRIADLRAELLSVGDSEE